MAKSFSSREFIARRAVFGGIAGGLIGPALGATHGIGALTPDEVLWNFFVGACVCAILGIIDWSMVIRGYGGPVLRWSWGKALAWTAAGTAIGFIRSEIPTGALFGGWPDRFHYRWV